MGNTDEKIALAIFLLSIAAIPIVAFSDVDDLMTGRAVADIPNADENAQDTAAPALNEERPTTCIDSDSGRAYLTIGEATYCQGNDCERKQDSCSGKKLTEWYCKDNKAAYEQYDCTVGCDEGACLTKTTNYVQDIIPQASIEQASNSIELSSETMLELSNQDSVKLKISGKEYNLKLTSVTDTYVTLNLDNFITFIMGASEDKNLDLNNDGMPDLYLRVKSISVITKRVRLVLSQSH